MRVHMELFLVEQLVFIAHHVSFIVALCTSSLFVALTMINVLSAKVS